MRMACHLISTAHCLCVGYGGQQMLIIVVSSDQGSSVANSGYGACSIDLPPVCGFNHVLYYGGGDPLPW